MVIRMGRIDKINYYLDIAETIAERATCIRRNFGAVIVKNDEIISTGYNGAPRGRVNCSDIGKCIREEKNIPRGTCYELCRSVHAEANAIISSARRDMIGSTLYLVCKDYKTKELVPGTNSCSMCKRLVINSGIEKIIVRDDKENYRIIDVEGWVTDDESLEGKNGY
jgi:dCMP deaminase